MKVTRTRQILISILCPLLLLLGLAARAPAADALKAFAGTSTDVGTTLSYYIASAYSENGGAPIVTYVNATSDKAASVLQFYTCTTACMVTGVNSTVTIPMATNGFSGYVANAILILRHTATDTYERRIVSTATTTNVVLTAAPTTATAYGDLVYVCTAAGAIPVTATTKELDGPGIYAGQAGKPLLVDLDATSACQINAISGYYLK